MPLDRTAPLAGAVAGVAECVAVQPLDMVKTRFQLVAGPGAVRPSVAAALRQLVREGGVPRLYRGILPELAAMAPKSSAMYSSYQAGLMALGAVSGDDRRPPAASSLRLHFLAGAMSGVPEAAIVTPFQVVKVRLQAREHLDRYTSTLHCVRTVLAEEGALALTAGFYATCWRNCAWNSVYFASMHALREARLFGGERRARNNPRGGGILLLAETVRTAVLGFAAGVFATCFNAPFDVAKSRLQAARPGDGVGLSLRAQLWAIFREEGVAGLYAGFAPKAMRMGLGGAVGIAAFEVTSELLRR
jgi:solute carrier family 25 2-oxodicarboxylate transporter 21